MRLIGYVSDERFLAIPDALLAFSGTMTWADLRSSADGSVRGDIPPGRYEVAIAHPRFGSKRTVVNVGGSEADTQPHHFRLLSERPLGYVWPKWVRAGEVGSVRIHSPEPYRLALVRLGLGTGPETLLGWIDEHGPRTTVQVTPDDDYTQTGLGWDEHAAAVAPDRTGLYMFRAETSSGQRFSFPWVVAPAEPSARIAVLASTNTWNAYNTFGGRSNYVSATRLPNRPTLVRADLARHYEGPFFERRDADDAYLPLSFERPEPTNVVSQVEKPSDPLRGRQPGHLAAGEWRLLAWLEREGFAYDLYADAQLHDGTLELYRYGVLILSVHPEYWSREMFGSVKRWVFHNGGKLAYLGGNGIDCEVEFVDRGRALHFLTKNPEPGESAETRMHRTFDATASLLGVSFTKAGETTGAPYQVVDETHWAFAKTGLSAGDTFGSATLHERCPGGASGHETDKRTASSPVGTRLLAKGLNPDDGGAEMVHFETPSSGAVFSVGSINWVPSLFADDLVSRITRNVLERFSDS
jgi:hypothetical protein